METELVRPKITQVRLPNHPEFKLSNPERGKKIDLQELYYNLKSNDSFKASFDIDTNPRQNWVTINISGQAKIYSKGTITTDLNLNNEALIEFFAKFYSAYIKEVIK